LALRDSLNSTPIRHHLKERRFPEACGMDHNNLAGAAFHSNLIKRTGLLRFSKKQVLRLRACGAPLRMTALGGKAGSFDFVWRKAPNFAQDDSGEEKAGSFGFAQDKLFDLVWRKAPNFAQDDKIEGWRLGATDLAKGRDASKDSSSRRRPVGR
jgi:hypothetical protein